MTKYSFNIHWSEEDEGYVVKCPEFPGLSAFGETPDKAVAEAQVALELMIEAYEERSLELPEPRKLEQFSGQFRVRIPKTLHRQAVEMAEQEGVSLNAFVATAIASKVGEEAAKWVSRRVGQLPVICIVVGSTSTVATTTKTSGVPTLQLPTRKLAGVADIETAVTPSNNLIN